MSHIEKLKAIFDALNHLEERMDDDIDCGGWANDVSDIAYDVERLLREMEGKVCPHDRIVVELARGPDNTIVQGKCRVCKDAWMYLDHDHSMRTDTWPDTDNASKRIRQLMT